MAQAGEVAEGGGRRIVLLVALLCFTAAAALILLAARGSLWFDEIWSLTLAERCPGPWDVLEQRFDNNHVLNTLYLWAVVSESTSAHRYRLLSVISGIASVGIVAWIASRRSAGEGLLALVLVASSYPLVLYWSEARGYAPAMLCALVAFAILRSTWTRLGPGRVLAFWLALALGILAHLTFVLAAFALGVAAVVRELRSTDAPWIRLARLAVLFLVPLAFFAAFWMTFVRDMRVIGGPVLSYRQVVATAAIMLLGLPDGARWQTPAMLGCLAVVVAGSVVAWRRRPEEGAFYMAVLLVGPFGLLAATRPEHLYFRYFVVAFPFFCLLLAQLLGVACRGRRSAWALATLLVVGPWLVGHGRRVEALVVWGRGDDRAALRRIATHSPPGELRIGCDGETQMLLDFYARELPPDQTVRAIDASRWRTELPEWLITRSLQRGYDPPPELELGESVRYRRVETYRHGGASGWTSFLWRREDEQTAGR